MNKHLVTKEMERLGIKVSNEELENQEILDRIHFLREVKKQIENEIHTLDRKLGKKMLDLQRRKNGSNK
jgi:isopentenyldiphosphate isomerase